MKHLKTITVPETTKEVIDSVTCDLCGNFIGPGPWAVEETKITCRKGTAYPEGYFAVEKSVDICVPCFESRLIPWLESQGCVIQARDVEN